MVNEEYGPSVVVGAGKSTLKASPGSMIEGLLTSPRSVPTELGCPSSYISSIGTAGIGVVNHQRVIRGRSHINRAESCNTEATVNIISLSCQISASSWIIEAVARTEPLTCMEALAWSSPLIYGCLTFFRGEDAGGQDAVC